MIKDTTKTITDIDGVFGDAVACGIKEKADLSLIYVPDAVACAGVFTQHQFPASSVTHTKKALKRHILKSVVVNSGNTNAATGSQGEKIQN